MDEIFSLNWYRISYFDFKKTNVHIEINIFMRNNITFLKYPIQFVYRLQNKKNIELPISSTENSLFELTT